MESGFPDRQTLRIEGQEVSVTVYAFALGADKIPKARMYRSGDYGMVFSLNNQTQARNNDWRLPARMAMAVMMTSESWMHESHDHRVVHSNDPVQLDVVEPDESAVAGVTDDLMQRLAREGLVRLKKSKAIGCG